jgi:hypothetical protein
MRRLIFLVSVLAALAAAPGSASAASEHTFKFHLQCRAPGPFEGTVTFRAYVPETPVNYWPATKTWTCSDQNQTIQDELTVEMSDWEDAGFGELEFRSTAFEWPFGGCSWGFGPESLETPGHPGRYGQFYCAPSISSNEPSKNIWMQAQLFSAGDQPGYIGGPS